MGFTKEELISDRVFKNFYLISQIPHGSGNEKGISDYLLNWALVQGLEAEQDEALNVLIRKPATAGYENAPAVMLQAHMDMVCEKAEDVDFDFEKEHVHWVVEGDLLSTGGKTTLGADDGIGIALAMAVLASEDLQHPALEVLFTTMEEEDLSGADRFDTSKMKANLLINLDHTQDNEILCGSCGGMQVDIRIPVIADAPPQGWKSYRLSVSGLKGGHSGEDIHRGRGNANILLNRMLMAIEWCCYFQLGAIKGGSFRLAIPREAEAIVWFDPANEEQVRSKLEQMQTMARSELAETANNVKVTLEPTEAPAWGIHPTRVLNAIALCPDGIYQMNEMLTGLVDTSDNLGEIYLDQHELHLVLEIRAARESRREYLFQRMQRLANMFGGNCHWSNAYPSWDFRPQSYLRELACGIYEEKYGSKPAFFTVHAGLEVGCFYATKSEIDAISMGPNCWDFHSPSESVSISSTHKVFDYLGCILAAIR